MKHPLHHVGRRRFLRNMLHIAPVVVVGGLFVHGFWEWVRDLFRPGSSRPYGGSDGPSGVGEG